MSRKRRRHEEGITLVELSVVLGVVAILAAIAIPSYVSMLPHIALKNAAADVSTLFMQSKMRSIAEMKYFRVTFNLADDSRQLERGSVVFDAGSGTNIIQWSVEEAADKVSQRVDTTPMRATPLCPPSRGTPSSSGPTGRPIRQVLKQSTFATPLPPPRGTG